MNIIYGNVHIWTSYTVFFENYIFQKMFVYDHIRCGIWSSSLITCEIHIRHPIIFIYQTPKCSHVKSYINIIYRNSYTNFICQLHIPNFIYQLHTWKSHKSHVKSHTVVKTVVYDDHIWCSHVIIIYRSENVDCWTSYTNIIYQHDSLSYVSIIYQSSYTNIIYHND